MADSPQSFQSHTKWDPLFHFVLMPLFLANFIYRCYDLVHFLMSNDAQGSWMRPAGGVVMALGLVLLTFKTRIYALHVQDRLIRLEERLRLASILPEALKPRIHELTERQLIALRFASDGELTALTQAALDNKMDPKQIKSSIRTWRPDNFRA